MKKRILSLFVVLAMAISMLTGCGSGDKGTEKDTDKDTKIGTEKDTKTEGENTEKKTDDLSKSRELKIWLYKDDYKGYYDSYNENPVVQYLNDKFNCNLTFQQPAMGSEQEQFSLMLGTGSYTDIMEISYSTESITTLYEDGVVQDLSPYLKDYAPYFYAWLNKEENEDVKKALYDNEGHFFTIPMNLNVDDTLLWGGLVYRKDILETMTGGYVSFPSGNSEPTTIDDWEYMMELYNQYFMAAGFNDYAALILPYNGYFVLGELLNGFGTSAGFHVDDNGIVKYGPTQPEFYNYLVKMNEWYQKGYIYKDFASRTNDIFYLPNTSLTYGGAAGIWYGLSSQVGDAMSMPDYGLFVEVDAIAAPLDTVNGVTKALGNLPVDSDRAKMNSGGFVVSSSCSEENLIRWLTVCDYLYTEEGGMLKTYGLTADQGAAENVVYKKAGMENGAYSYDGTTFTFHEKMQPSVGAIRVEGSEQSFIGLRLPGIGINRFNNEASSEEVVKASNVWRTYGKDNNYPDSIFFNSKDSDTTAMNYSNYNDYLDSMVPKFIIGTEPLNEDTWNKFVSQMNSLGVEESTAIYQKYYDDYNKK